jgi:adenine deaminase
MTRPAASRRALAAARGDEPADLLIAGGRVFVPTSKEWIDTELAICDGVVVGWGARDATETVDVGGAALTAGFIDSHMHLESTKLWVDEFVRSVLPWGTTAVAADPHEVANVFGVSGVAALVAAASRLPFTFGVCASSCVPASPFESAGAELLAADVRALLEVHGAIGVAEVMNYPGVIAGDPDLVAKINAAQHRRVDGHAPGLSGPPLDAYLAAGVESDHECTQLAEAEEKRRKGMWVFLRQGSSTKNLADLIPMVLRGGNTHVALCTDDREPDLILERGHVNDCVRLAVEHGVAIEDALVLATMNAAEYHNFHHLGILAPGYQADVLAFDSLSPESGNALRPAQVWQRGRVVAENGAVVDGAVPSAAPPDWMLGSVHLAHRPAADDLDLGPPPNGLARVIGLVEGQVLTEHLVADVTDPAFDVARIAVLERHHATGRIGLGWVSGFGLQRGAIASTVAHDAHNCMVVGARDGTGPSEMAAAVARLAEIGGGQVAILDGRVLAEVPLPIGGLMSPLRAPRVADLTETVKRAAHDALGVTIEAPFMQLSFLGLSVIPHLRITDKGLVDVDAFTLTEVAAP